MFILKHTKIEYDRVNISDQNSAHGSTSIYKLVLVMYYHITYMHR